MATYYVANAGSDAASGTDSGHPFQTVAHVAGVLAAGDTVLFNRGDRWFETFVPPANTITVGAYGAAAVFDSDGYCTNAPIFDGGLAIGGWSAYTGGSVQTFFSSDSFTGTSGTALTSHTPNIGTGWALQSAGGTAVATLDGSGGVYVPTTGTEVYYMSPTLGLQNPSYFVQATVTFKTIVAGDIGGVAARAQASTKTYYGGILDSSGNLNIQKEASGTPGNVASTTTTVTAGTPYTLKIVVVGNVVTLYLNGTQMLTYTDPAPILGGTALFEARDPGIILHAGAAGETATTGVHISAFSCAPLDIGAGTNTYQKSGIATAPSVVDFNGTYCFQGVGINTLSNNEWYWYNGVVYFRNDAGVPANGSVVISQSNNCINASGKSALTIQDVACEHAQQPAYNFSGCPGLTLERCYGQRTSFSSSAVHGVISIDGTSTNTLVENGVFRQIAGTGFYGTSTCTGPITVQNNKFLDLYEQIAQGIEFSNTADVTAKVWRGNVVTIPMTKVGEYSNSEKGGLTFFGDNWLVERNLIIGGALYGSTHPGNSHTVRDNFYYRCGGGYLYTNLGMTGGGGAVRTADNAATGYTGLSVYRNVMLDCPCGPWVDSAGTANRSSFTYYNNLILNINVAPGVQNEQGAASGTYQAFFNQAMSGSFRNNIVHNAQGSSTGGLFFKSEISANAWTSDNNVWGPDATGKYNFKSTSYDTLAAYQAGQTRDTHSISTTPKFRSITYQPPSRPTLGEFSTALASFRNDWRSVARRLGIVVAGVTQLPAPDAGIEATYGYWGAAV